MSRIVALLLAAGFGRRFDPSGRTSKLLARVGRSGVARTSTDQLRAAGFEIHAVVRPEPQHLHDELTAAGAKLIVSERAAAGMGYSIADGITALTQTTAPPDGVLICLADMPFIPAPVYQQVARALSPEQTIVAAAVNGVRGHPVGFWHSEFAALATLEGDTGAGKLLKSANPLMIETGSSAVLQDIDQASDLPPAAND